MGRRAGGGMRRMRRRPDGRGHRAAHRAAPGLPPTIAKLHCRRTRRRCRRPPWPASSLCLMLSTRLSTPASCGEPSPCRPPPCPASGQAASVVTRGSTGASPRRPPTHRCLNRPGPPRLLLVLLQGRGGRGVHCGDGRHHVCGPGGRPVPPLHRQGASRGAHAARGARQPGHQVKPAPAPAAPAADLAPCAALGGMP